MACWDIKSADDVGLLCSLLGQGDSSLISPAPGRTKVVARQLLTDRLAKLPSNFERMVIVKSGIDASPKHLVHQITGIFEDVLMDAVGKRQAVRDEVYTSGPKIAGDHS